MTPTRISRFVLWLPLGFLCLVPKKIDFYIKKPTQKGNYLV